ncbi:MAG: TPM domain-containing protein [Deltaproteobacteria bacterium]|nr:TPM domain-containing protein [Deltaproteobacteria bacterium]
MYKKIIFALTFLLLTNTAFALEVPKLKERINDYAEILAPNQEAELENLLKNAETRTSSQIALLTITSLEKENLEDFSLKVIETWKLGQKNKDNGVLLLIALKEKKIRIEVGYGLEAVLTDAKSGFIIRNIIAPHFKKKKFYTGIKEGLAAIYGFASKEYQVSDQELAQYEKTEKQKETSHLPGAVLVLIVMLLFGGLGRRSGKGGGILPWLVVGSMLGSGRRSSSGFGGGFGGGFSGGGGGFGGGGASGGW